MSHSSADLYKASNKLEYHVMQYVKTFRWLEDSEGEVPGVPVANAIEDSHAVHARILIEFLKLGRGTDVNVNDFYPAETPSDRFPLGDSFLLKEKREIDRYILHLTSNDLTELISEIEWSRHQIARELYGELSAFVLDERATLFAQKDRESCEKHLDSLRSLLEVQSEDNRND